MATQYYNYFKGKAHRATARKAETPVISDDDEKFLNQLITSQDNAHPPVKDAQIALMDGAQNIPLPESPPELFEEPSTFPGLGEWAGTVASKKKAWTTWSWLRRDSRDATRHTATGGSDQGLKPPETEAGVEEEAPQDEEAKKEEEDMTMVLEQLNLAAVNNRVFSINDETQALLQKFNLIFKDLIHGGPTAYDDLEKLLTNGDRQLQQTFNSLPSFLQKLIEKLPESMTKGLGPEIMAAAAERAQKSGFHVENAGKAAAGASKAGLKIPGLKDLAGKPAAVTAMLRSIIRYLRARFPSFMGMNVLWSLAMFVLLFVFWYCHKRGKEVRLEKEQELTEQEVKRLDAEHRAAHPEAAPTTTADEGPPIESVEVSHVAADEESADPDHITAASVV